MAQQLTYNTTRVMEPLDGRAFATTYYQQNHQQRTETLAHIQSVVEAITEVCARDHEMREFIQKPLRAFPRTTNRANYSLIDIVSDLAEQLAAGKDIPSGMLGRWNRLFEGTAWDIELVAYVSPNQVRRWTFDRLFGE